MWGGSENDPAKGTRDTMGESFGGTIVGVKL